MALTHRQSQPTAKPFVVFLLIAFLMSNAASLRVLLEAQNDSADNSAKLSDEEKRITSLASETLRDADEDGLSLNLADEDMDGPTLALPQFFDRVISSAFSSMDRVSSGLLSGLAGPNVEYGRSKDGKRLIARLHLPAVENRDGKAPTSPKISVAVLGRSHLRVKLDMHGDGIQSYSEHTYGLPVHVCSQDVMVTPQEDGTVHVSLRIVKDTDEVPKADTGEHENEGQTMDSFLERRLKNPFFPTLILHSSLKDPGSEEEVTEELPRPEDVEHCRAKYPNEKILRKKCTCDVTPSKAAKAVCYGSLISKAVSVARRLGLHDFATSAKHHAIECADDPVKAVECLERVASQLVHSLYKENASGKPGGRLEDRVRAAIESEDDGPSNFEPSYGTMFSLVLIALLVGLFACGVLLCSVRRFRGNSQSSRMLSELSSVLTQTTRRPNTDDELSSGRQGSRLGPFQGTPKPSNSRALRKPGPKSTSGDSKIA